MGKSASLKQNSIERKKIAGCEFNNGINNTSIERIIIEKMKKISFIDRIADITSDILLGSSRVAVILNPKFTIIEKYIAIV